MTGIAGTPARYFSQGTLFFTLSKRQRDFLANPPERIASDLGADVRRTATILAQNGLIRLSSDRDPQVTPTQAGQVALAFYDTLRALGDSR